VGNVNLPGFDFEYEQITGVAMIMYSANVGITDEIRYRGGEGSTWAGSVNYDSVRNSGIV
jgi:hypothetical protein